MRVRHKVAMDVPGTIHQLLEHGYSQADIARSLGADYRTVSFWARGLKEPDHKYAAMLGRLIREVIEADKRGDYEG